MVLHVQPDTTGTSGRRPRRTKSLNQAQAMNGVKTLSDHDDQGPPRKLSLLVDYSTQKANLSDKNAKELFPNKSFTAGTCRKSMVETIERALEESELACTSSTDDEDDYDDDDDDLEESFALDGIDDDKEMDKSEPISFRVRRSGLERCKSFDERKLSSYDHLQNSLSALIMAEADDPENDAADKDDKDKDAPKEGSISPKPSKPMPDRRMYLLRSRSVNMSAAATTNGKIGTGAGGSQHTPTARPSLAKIMRKTKSVRDILAQTNHDGTGCGRPKSQLAPSKRCASCRNHVRRSKSMNDSKFDCSLQFLEESFNKSVSLGASKSCHNASSNNSKDTPRSPKRSCSSHQRRPTTISSSSAAARGQTMMDDSSISSISDVMSPKRRSVIRKLDKNGTTGRGSMMATSALQRSLVMMNNDLDMSVSRHHQHSAHDPMKMYGGRSRIRRLDSM